MLLWEGILVTLYLRKWTFLSYIIAAYKYTNYDNSGNQCFGGRGCLGMSTCSCGDDVVYVLRCIIIVK